MLSAMQRVFGIETEYGITIHGTESVDVVAEFVWEDWLAAQTVPNFYGGFDPIVGRGAPRLRVVVYRMVQPWAVPGR